MNMLFGELAAAAAAPPPSGPPPPPPPRCRSHTLTFKSLFIVVASSRPYKTLPHRFLCACVLTAYRLTLCTQM